MTVLCGGAASGPKSIAPAVAYLSGQTLETLLQATLGLSEAWAAVIVFAAAQSIDLTGLCATDPPAMPAFTAQDVGDILNGNPILNPVGWGKLGDLVLNGVWYAFCQCSTTSTPAAPAAPTYPATAPVVNPPLPVGKLPGFCWDVASSHSRTTVATQLNLTSQMVPSAQTATVTAPFVGGPTTAAVLPTGLSQFSASIRGSGGATNGANIIMHFWNASGVELSGQILASEGFPVTSYPLTPLSIPAGANSWMLIMSWGNGPSLENYAIEIAFICPETIPNTPVTPCCPPDPVLQAKLDQIMSLLDALYRGLPASSHSLSEGTVHAGLTGSGNFAIASTTVAFKVSVTTVPGRAGLIVADPTEYLDLGFITTSAAEGAYKSSRIEHSPQLFFVGPFVDTIHYTLTPGVVVTVTELSRGP